MCGSLFFALMIRPLDDWSPRLHLRHDDGVRSPAIAVRASEPKLRHGHVGATAIDQGLQVCIRLVAAGLAGHCQPQTLRSEHCPRRRLRSGGRPPPSVRIGRGGRRWLGAACHASSFRHATGFASEESCPIRPHQVDQPVGGPRGISASFQCGLAVMPGMSYRFLGYPIVITQLQ